MAYFQFNDGALRTLTNLHPVASRFENWRPIPLVQGTVHEAMGSGMPYIKKYREDHKVYLELPYVKPSDLETAVRLVLHAQRRQLVTIGTTDTANRIYTGYLPKDDVIDIVAEPDDAEFYRIVATFILIPSVYPLLTYA